jgi:hypothetical protein
MLGLCALHFLAKAISEYYGLGKWVASLCCDNKRALLLSSHHNGRIRPSAKCADIRRSFKATKQTYQGGFKYIHVYGHMDRHLSWWQLTLTQQLNCICNSLAKQAVTNAVVEGYNADHTQLLPREDVALIVWGDKITGDILGVHSDLMQVRQLHASIIHTSGKMVNGHRSNSRKSTGNTSISLSSSKQTTTKYGVPNRPQTSAGQEYKWDYIPGTSTRTNAAATVAPEKQTPT